MAVSESHNGVARCGEVGNIRATPCLGSLCFKDNRTVSEMSANIPAYGVWESSAYSQGVQSADIIRFNLAKQVRPPGKNPVI